METPYSPACDIGDSKTQMNKPCMDDLRNAYHKLYSSPKILVVDDEETDFISLKKMFEHFGVQLFHSASIEDARSILTDSNFSLIMLDWKLPNSSGGELLDFLNETHNPIPVAIYTGYADSETLTEASKKRAVALISKPITFKQIGQLLELFKLS